MGKQRVRCEETDKVAGRQVEAAVERGGEGIWTNETQFDSRICCRGQLSRLFM